MSTTKQGYTFRKLMGDLHLWLGVGSGLVLFVVCLSGTILTFWPEIEETVEAASFRVVVPAGGQPLPAATLAARLERAHPEAQVTSISIPAVPTKVWAFTMQTRASLQREAAEARAEKLRGPAQGGPNKGGRGGKGKGGHGRRDDFKTYRLNPYSGAEQGAGETATGKFMFTMMGLHRWLLIEGVGQVIVGVSTIIFLVLELTGLVLWAPAKLRQWRTWKMWKPGFQVKWSGNWKRLNYDLHNTLGFYTFGLLTVMALTGLCWSFQWYRDGASALLGAKVFGFRGEKPLASAAPATAARPLSADDFLALTRRQLPQPGTVLLTLPKGPAGAATIYHTPGGFFTLAASDRLTFDQYSGAILKRDVFAEKPWNEQLVSLIRPLHMGDVGGTFTKILYFLACLIATSLPLTGVIIWLNKLRKQGKRKPAVPVGSSRSASASAVATLPERVAAARPAAAG